MHTWPEYGFVASDFLSRNGQLNAAKIGTYMARMLNPKDNKIDLEVLERGVKPEPKPAEPKPAAEAKPETKPEIKEEIAIQTV